MKFLAILFALLIGCSTSIKDYEGSMPEFKIDEFFQGDLKVYGMVLSRSNKVIRRFEADIKASWQGNKGILDEDFIYDDGEIDKRIWQLTINEDNSITGTAGDVVGEAKGSINGFAFNWKYTLAIKVDNKTWNINLDDWIYQINNKRLLNKTVMKKFGFKVGEIILVIEK